MVRKEGRKEGMGRKEGRKEGKETKEAGSRKSMGWPSAGDVSRSNAAYS